MNEADLELIRRRIALEELARPLLAEIRRLTVRDCRVRSEFENFRRGLCNFEELCRVIEAESGEEPPPVERALKTLDSKG